MDQCASKMAVGVSQSELFFELKLTATMEATILLSVSANQSRSFNCKWLPAMQAVIFKVSPSMIFGFSLKHTVEYSPGF